MRKVYAIPLVPVNGAKSITIQAFSVSEVSAIAVSMLRILRMFTPI